MMDKCGWVFAIAIAVCGISGGIAYVDGEEQKAIGKAVQAGCDVETLSNRTTITCSKVKNEIYKTPR